jgi:hypothetical protein
VDRSTAQHDLAGSDLLRALPLGMHDDTRDPTVLDEETTDQSVTANFEIGSPACRLEITFKALHRHRLLRCAGGTAMGP